MCLLNECSRHNDVYDRSVLCANFSALQNGCELQFCSIAAYQPQSVHITNSICHICQKIKVDFKPFSALAPTGLEKTMFLMFETCSDFGFFLWWKPWAAILTNLCGDMICGNSRDTAKFWMLGTPKWTLKLETSKLSPGHLHCVAKKNFYRSQCQFFSACAPTKCTKTMFWIFETFCALGANCNFLETQQ